ncbi:MAG: hypothetical protein ACK5YR_21725 [Pirellula sp.]|jgi:hypothetical protein
MGDLDTSQGRMIEPFYPKPCSKMVSGFSKDRRSIPVFILSRHTTTFWYLAAINASVTDIQIQFISSQGMLQIRYSMSLSILVVIQSETKNR